MLESLLEYIRAWFPSNELPQSSGFSRKRRGSDTNSHFKSPKHRKILSSMANNILEDDIFTSPLRSNRHEAVVLDDEDDIRVASKPIDIKTSRKSRENRWETNGTDDLRFLKSIKSTTEKKLDAKRNNVEYITRFATSYEPHNGVKAKSRVSPISRNVRSGRSSLSNSFSTPTLDYSIRLDDKKKYEMLLDNVATLQNSYSFNNSSTYGTPVGSLFNRSRRLVELAKSPNKKPVEVIDLTENKRKLSTKDTVIKVLDDFESEEVIEDSDSDVEILPNPPSPKPDIKVPPINSLKTVVDTSKPTHQKWLQDITKNHERFVEDKSKEIEAYTENSSALNEINRNLLIKSLTKKVQDSLAIKEAILPIEEEEEEVELPPLTDEQLRMVKKAFSGDPNEVLTKKFNLNVTRRDMQTLSGLNWLNDNVINFYMNLIMERGTDSKWPRTYATNTFFYQKLSRNGPDSLKRWTRRVDIFSYEFICVPIHLGMHWCMAIINLKERTIKYYDSMGKSNNQCLNALRNYLEFEHMDKKGQPFSTEDFVLENVQDIPQQMNGSDCGMFSCTFAEFATRKARFTFQQEDMPYLRKKMVVEILTGQLLIQ
ncbi:sentrin-specific protease 1-like [Tribolium madens]|uniref:sentrin-specific protease 1-like n=1 Tax=Tribolium madens TaxID=41895 RepID=UPI001CF72922|nr:sentrin-specific protease 1-like [Tribolium madens]